MEVVQGKGYVEPLHTDVFGALASIAYGSHECTMELACIGRLQTYVLFSVINILF